MKEFAATFEVCSPRWGHTDKYEVGIDRDKLVVTQGAFSATCQRGENGDPEWSGYNDDFGNPLMNIFNNDAIFAPDIVPFALEYAWQRWKEGAADDAQLLAALAELFAWVDTTARGKPSGPFWDGAF